MSLDGDPEIVNNFFDCAPGNPIKLLNHWFLQANNLGVSEPYGFVLSTISSEYGCSSRVVLAKEIDDLGVIFSTSENSRKGKEIYKDPNVSANFWWRETLQQIEIKGQVVKLSAKESEDIFQNRVRSAKVIAVVSQQSIILDDENILKSEVASIIASEEKIAKPDSWHAYRIIPNEVEFWHGSPDRFHRRLKYIRQKDEGWSHFRLQP
ncbi:MAG: pyridoxal 5'-phosphate synthase [Cellvibrionaceae bacterium]